MNARAVVPDFELPATGNPRYLLPAFAATRWSPASIRRTTPPVAPRRARTRAVSLRNSRANVDVFGVSFGGQGTSGREP